jgi:hypothetical protein
MTTIPNTVEPDLTAAPVNGFTVAEPYGLLAYVPVALLVGMLELAWQLGPEQADADETGTAV